MLTHSSMLITFFALLVLGTEDRLLRENARLSKSNAVLLKTLRGLMEEMEVGEELVGQSAKSTCPALAEFQACDGQKQELGNLWARRAEAFQIWQYTHEFSMTNQEWCQLKCQNMGIPGCCEWQDDNRKCLFTAFSSSTIPNSGSRKVYGSGSSAFTYTEKGLRYASVCSVPNCVYQMEPLVWRKMECDWDGLDKVGQDSKGGKNWSVEECNNWCLNDPGCVFASRSSTGYCHSFKTCNHEPSGTGWVTYQKVCQGTLEYNNGVYCTDNLDPKYCISPPFF